MRWIGREETITSSTDFEVPEAKDQLFQVTLWGAGGSGSTDGSIGGFCGGAGGGAGEMKFKELTLNKGDRIHIEIGQGGPGVSNATSVIDYCGHMIGRSGGPTIFGNYFMANGGLGGFASQGGDGAYDGGNSGQTAEGNYLGFGMSGVVGGVTVSSGGGAGAVNARGMGGSANRSSGNGGTGAGGAGCFVEVGPNNTISRRIGSGGQGVCSIRYYAPIGD